MKTFALIAAVLGLLVAGAPAGAARGTPGQGGIYYEMGSIGCGFSATTADGVWYAAFGSGSLALRLIGGSSFADTRIGFVCEGSVAGQGLPLPAKGSVTISGLTCTLTATFPELATVPLGDFEASGSVSLSANGDVKATCPVSKRG